MLKTAMTMYAMMDISKQHTDLKSDDDIDVRFNNAVASVIKTYVSDFETPFLKASRQFWRTKAEVWVAEDSMSEYLAKVCSFGFL
jgi:hypothetical protein